MTLNVTESAPFSIHLGKKYLQQVTLLDLFIYPLTKEAI